MTKRLFTFGCSYTNYYWPTWADILGTTYDHYENWAVGGIGNRGIVERLSECLLKNKLTKDDTVIVQWTDFHRHDIHNKKEFQGWRAGGNVLIHEKDVPNSFILKYWDEFSYIMHTMNFINLGINLLKNQSCVWFMTSSTDLTKDIKQYPELNFYKKLFDEDVWIDPIQRFVDTLGYTGIDSMFLTYSKTFKNYVKEQVRDLHPTSQIYLKWLEKYVVPKLKITLDNQFINTIRSEQIKSLDLTNMDRFKHLNWLEDQHNGNSL
jgi:hypothetical protein